MQKYEDNVTTPINGALQPLQGISVTITDQSTNLAATVYDDDEVTVLTQPLTTDAVGYFGFKAADGKYTLTFSGSRITTFTREAILEDPEDQPYATLAQLATGGGAEIIGYTRPDASITTVQVAIDELSSGASVQTTVRGTPLTGLSTATNAVITATDTVLSAFGKLQKQFSDFFASKDASGGIVGLTLFKINFKNVANTFTSFFTNSNTAARTYTFPDKDGTVAMTSDVPNPGAWRFVTSTTVGSAVSSVDFLSNFTSTYDVYRVVMIGIGASSATSKSLNVRFATGGAADTTTAYAAAGPDNSPLTSGATELVISSTNSTNGTATAITFEISNANASGAKPVFIYGNGGVTLSLKIGAYNSTPAVTGFRVYWSTGNINAGTIYIYGLSKT